MSCVDTGASADERAVEDRMATVDRLRRLRADRAAGRVSDEEFVEQRHHLLDRRRQDLPYSGPERRRSRPGGHGRCEWCTVEPADIVPAQLVAAGRLLVDGVRLCTSCTGLVSLEEGMYAVTAEPSVVVTFLTEIYRRRAALRVADADEQRRDGRRSTDRRSTDRPAEQAPVERQEASYADAHGT